MGRIVNLRRARKAKDRAEKEKAAAGRRLEHAMPKSVRDLAKARAEKAARDLDGHKRD